MKKGLLGAIIAIFVILVAVAVFDTVTAPPTELRAALDIGSGTTNLKIAQVDITAHKINKLVLEKILPVPYQKHLELSSNKTFDRDVMDQGIIAINTLKETADSYHVKGIVAVATAAFRNAENAADYAKEIRQLTNVDVKIISQQQEGVLAFVGALSKASAKPEQAIVWDIGGGSFQLTTLDDQGHYVVEKGTDASIPFKNYVIEKIQGKNIKEVTTPNPLSSDDMKKAIEHAEKVAQQINPSIRAKIAQKETTVLAVGNLFNFGIRSFVEGKSTFSREELESAVVKYVGVTDTQLGGGSIAETKVSNALLVLGFMKALDIKKVTILDVNNADGALTYPDYWK